jgi:hypothetical protein
MKAFDLFEYQSIMMKGNWTWTGYRQRVRLNVYSEQASIHRRLAVLFSEGE